MVKLIILITFLTCVSFSLSKQYWQCDSSGKIFCHTNETCCPNDFFPDGYACFLEVDGVCCNDGIHICPHGYTCLKGGSCDAPFLFGLGRDIKYNAPVLHEPYSSLDLFKGFMEGIAIFNNLPHADKCSDKDFNPIEQEVVDIISIIRGIEFDFESIAKIGQLIAKLTELYDSFNKVVGPCQEYAREMQDVILRVKEHVESASYLTSLPVHLLMEMSNLKSIAIKATEDFNELKYQVAGQGYGDLVHVALLWDFK
jgi:hypothetical protein